MRQKSTFFYKNKYINDNHDFMIFSLFVFDNLFFFFKISQSTILFNDIIFLIVELHTGTIKLFA